MSESLQGRTFDIISIVSRRSVKDPFDTITRFLKELSGDILGFKDMIRNIEPEIMISLDGLDTMTKSVYRYLKSMRLDLANALNR